jgi:hypothetical protein
MNIAPVERPTSTYYSNNLDRVKSNPSIPEREKELLASFLTIADYRNLLFDPKVNIGSDLTTDYINESLRIDLSMVINGLRDYEGPMDVRKAMEYVEGAVKELYNAGDTTVSSERVNALFSCRGKLDSAYKLLMPLEKEVREYQIEKHREQVQLIPSNLQERPKDKQKRSVKTQPLPESGKSARQTFLFQSANARIDVYFGGEPPTLVPWEINVDALVIPVGTLGSLSGKMAEGFLDALGQQSQNFRSLLKNKRSARLPTNVQPNLSRYIGPETPLLLDINGKFPNIKPRYIIAATAYRREGAQITENEDESQDKLEIINAGNAADAIIRLASEAKIATLAIPLLGTGAAGLPSIEVAQDMAAMIREAVVGTSIQQVILLTRDWGAYNSLVEKIKHTPQRSNNDKSEGTDYLKVKAEVDALADTLLLAETETPLAVGILGGWGSGKSFAMRLLHERMAQIRALPVSMDYVGHPYLIDFDAWTYTKSNLWSSLMQTIFLELNRQIERENDLPRNKEATAIEKIRCLYPGTWGPTSTVDAGKETLWQQMEDYRSVERRKLEKEEKRLAKKREELEKKHKAAAEEVDQAIQEELDQAIWQPLWDALSQPFGRAWKDLTASIFGKATSKKARDAGAFRTWVEFTAFGFFALVAFLVPQLLDSFSNFRYAGTLLAIGAVIAGVLRTFDRWRNEVEEARTKIRDSRDARLEAKLEEKKDEIDNIKQQIKKLELEVLDARRLAGVTAIFKSLLDLCQARLRQADYENELGLMHRVKLDLDEMDWALKNAPKEPKKKQKLLFWRGKPRIILFIDDLDRCPPRRVVEVLEATQLLLKTQLFVVVLAMDIRFVTLALEKAYTGILTAHGDPSGLDYIEKIIQIPYHVRPVDSKVVEGYISSMMTVQTDASKSKEIRGEQSDPSPESRGIHATEVVIGGEISEKPHTVRKPKTLSSISQVVAFSKEEHEFLVLCCQQVSLTPRAIKRLVNVYKLLKILWSGESQWLQPEPTVEQAIVLLLTLSCSYPDAMREAFEEMEIEIRLKKIEAKQPRKLSKFFETDHSTSTNPILVDEWKKLQSDLQSLWAYEKKNKNLNTLKNLSLEKMEEVLPLVYSFSFVSDLGL